MSPRSLGLLPLAEAQAKPPISLGGSAGDPHISCREGQGWISCSCRVPLTLGIGFTHPMHLLLQTRMPHVTVGCDNDIIWEP